MDGLCGPAPLRNDPGELSAIEGGNILGDFFNAVGSALKSVGDGLSTLGNWFNHWF